MVSTKRAGFVAWWGDGERPKGPNGEKLCCMCPNPIAKGRQNYCSKECVDRRMILTRPGFARSKVAERDRGVCAGCGFDTEAIEQEFKEAYGRDKESGNVFRRRCSVCEMDLTKYTGQADDYYRHCGQPTRPVPWEPEADKVRAKLLQRGYSYDFVMSYHGWAALWEADHIVPVVEGGGQCGLDNYRTLCLPCHKGETATLAKRLAHRRRAEKKRDQRQLFGAGDGEAT